MSIDTYNITTKSNKDLITDCNSSFKKERKIKSISSYDAVQLAKLNVEYAEYWKKYYTSYKADINQKKKKNAALISQLNKMELSNIISEYKKNYIDNVSSIKKMIADGFISYKDKAIKEIPIGSANTTLQIEINYKFGIITNNVKLLYNKLSGKYSMLCELLYSDIIDNL